MAKADIDYAQRVARGAALLDSRWPNWRDQVDLGRLDIASAHDCMTAQFAQWTTDDGFADFSDGKNSLGLSTAGYLGHGFNADQDESAEVGSDERAAHYSNGIAALNALWRDLIVQHRYSPEPRQEGDAA